MNVLLESLGSEVFLYVCFLYSWLKNGYWTCPVSQNSELTGLFFLAEYKCDILLFWNTSSPRNYWSTPHYIQPRTTYCRALGPSCTYLVYKLAETIMYVFQNGYSVVVICSVKRSNWGCKQSKPFVNHLAWALKWLYTLPSSQFVLQIRSTSYSYLKASLYSGVVPVSVWMFPTNVTLLTLLATQNSVSGSFVWELAIGLRFGS